jgi:hypothetical protein
MTVEFKSWDELTVLEQAQSTYWDMHKDAYGVRPRCIDTSAWTIEDFEAEFVILGQAIEAEDKARKEAEATATVVFEQRIQSLIDAGAKDRTTAIRWIHEAEDTQGDDEYLCYTLGLPYQYFRKVA